MNNNISMKIENDRRRGIVIQTIIISIVLFSMNCIGICKPSSLADLNIMTFRKIAYNTLSEQDQKTVSDAWREAVVERYYEKVSVTFQTGDPILGGIIVIVDPLTNKVIGILPRL